MNDDSSPTYDVFISYRWVEPDMTWVRNHLVPALKLAGLEVCWDEQDFAPGRDVELEMRRAVQASHHAICVFSPDYVEGGQMVNLECQWARERDPMGESSHLIPMIIRQVSLPDHLSSLVRVDWTRPERNPREWKRLLKVLGARNPAADMPICCVEPAAGITPVRLRDQPIKPNAICLPSEAPSLPEGHLSRGQYLSAVGSVMGEIDSARPRLRLILGDSGVGKSTLASQFFREASVAFKTDETRWIDCRVTFELPEPVKKCRLIVFDNVGNNHPVVEANWLKDLSDSIVVLTTVSDRVVTKIRGATGTMDWDPCLVRVSEFSADEISGFAGRNIPPEHRSFVITKASELGGSPVMLQLLRELCLAETFAEDSLNISQSSGIEGVLDLWLLNRDENGALTTVIEILSSIPFVGMDIEALTEVSSLPEEEVTHAVELLVRVGLVTQICVPVSRGGLGTVLAMHESVREIYRANQPKNLPEWQRSYLGLLERRLASDVATSNDVLTCVDAWIGGWHQVFDLSANVDQDTRYQRHMGLLSTIVDSDSGVWMVALNSIPHFLGSLVQDPGKESCAIVIGVSHMISAMKGNRALANAIWLGCRNPDGWARGAAIAAAVRQWEKLGSVHKRRGRDELHHWLTYAYQMHDMEKDDPSSDSWWFSLGFDLMAAVCGLARLDNINEALRVVQSSEFKRRCSSTSLAHLALVVLLCDQQVLQGRRSEDARSRGFLELVNEWTVGVRGSVGRVQQTAFRIGQYILSCHDVSITALLELADPGRTPTFALDVARLCNSQSLAEFTLKSEDGASYYI